MRHRNTLLICGMYLAIATSSLAQHSQNSIATRADGGLETAVLYNVPNGTGFPFASAKTLFGNTIDATISLIVIDNNGNPVPNFSREDIWIESADGGLVVCCGGSSPDANTDTNGETTWASPLRVGGFSEALTRIFIDGIPLENSPGLAISHNSPDMNGDGWVNLSDVAIFSVDFNSGLQLFRSDFDHNGLVNLSDVVMFATTVGSACLPPIPEDLCDE